MFRRLKASHFVALAIGLVLFSGHGLSAYPVAYPYNLEQLNAKSDIIVKAIVIDSEPLEDEWFESVHGFESVTTKLKIISVVKGDVKNDDEIQFQHYTASKRDFVGMFAVQSYDLEKGQPHILLAKATDQPGVFRQCWKNHTLKFDQGALRAASDASIRFDNLKEAYWHELSRILGNEYRNDARREKDLLYAINQLDIMSGGQQMGTSHFDRVATLRIIAPFVRDEKVAVARKSIQVLASNNPYATRLDNPFWLASKGGGHIPGFSDNYKDYVNLGGMLHWRLLCDVADSNVEPELRVLAIRALGTIARPEIRARMDKWLKDSQVEVRAAAVSLVGDYPSVATNQLLKKAVADDNDAIRRAAIQAIGNGQLSESTKLLEQLLDDKDPRIASSAALNLLSFSIVHNKEIMNRNVDHPNFGLLFGVALAKLGESPEPYLDQLCRAAKTSIMDQVTFSHWWGGQHPSGQAWEILLAYANSKTPAEINAVDFQPVIDALEYSISTDPMKSDDTQAEASEDWVSMAGSHVVEGIYKLYVSKGLTKRAAEFRKLCEKRLTFDSSVYFERVDRAHR